MPFLALTLHVKGSRVEVVSDALLAHGAISVDVADAAAGTVLERPVFREPGWDQDSVWDHCRIVALFAADADPAVALAAASEAAGSTHVLACQADRVDDQDWVRLTQEQFLPMCVGERLWVVPSWHKPPRPDAVNIILDPGLAFGTGAHPTTRLCLRWLEQAIRGGETLIDYGCGSGILAIAGMRLGAGAACGVDIDPQALLAAQHNAVQNRVAAKFFGAADGLPCPADIVVANILANPLRVLAPLLARLTLPGGRIALSGILVEQAEEIEQLYACWFDIAGRQEDGGWTLVSGTRR